MEIGNKFLTARFQIKGAELISLQNQKGTEYIWTGNPDHWARHAPVLFPFVGKLKNNQFRYDGSSYPMGQHGFARDMDFEVESQTTKSITFLLKSSGETLAKFPFEFALRITYALSESQLSITYKVTNPVNKTLYFSIGGHPAFNCPLDGVGRRSDYSLEFEQDESAKSHLLVDGNFSGETKSTVAQGTIPIRDDLFANDALVYKNLLSNNVTLLRENSRYLTFHFDDFPYLGIWSKSSESPFVCIEPWYGLADHQNHDGDLRSKEGIQQLASKETFSCTYIIEIHS